MDAIDRLDTDVNSIENARSDDSTLRVWDWELYREERTLPGHGWDVKTCEWHPFKSLIASGSKVCILTYLLAVSKCHSNSC